MEEERKEGQEELAEEVSAEREAPAETTEETVMEVASNEASAPVEEKKKATPGKIALAVAAVIVLLAALIALIVVGLKDDPNVSPAETAVAEDQTGAVIEATIPADGNPGDVTCKGSYTVTDEEMLAAKDTVVATMEGRELTNGQLQVYYWMEVQNFLSNYGSYAMYFGMDYTQPLDTQMSTADEALTWQQYFLQLGLNNWQQVQSMLHMAEKTGMEASAEDQAYLDGLEAYVESIASSNGVTVDELMRSNFGPGAGMEEYRYFQETYLKGLPYYEAESAKLVPAQEDLEAFFAEHEQEYANSGVTKDSKFVDVRHILIQIEGGTTDENGVTTYSDEEWKTCEEEAQAILDTWLAGDKTEDSFAALASEKTEDPGSMATGGLYEQVYPGQMVQPFNDWCFDEARQYGDYGLVKTDYGYHVMFFVSSEPQWTYYAESDWLGEQTNKLLEEIVAAYPMEVDYEKIALGYINLGG